MLTGRCFLVWLLPTRAPLYGGLRKAPLSTRGKHTSWPNDGGQAAPSLCLSSRQLESPLAQEHRTRSRKSASRLQQVQEGEHTKQTEDENCPIVTAPNWEPKSLPADEWVVTVWYIHVMNRPLL